MRSFHSSGSVGGGRIPDASKVFFSVTRLGFSGLGGGRHELASPNNHEAETTHAGSFSSRRTPRPAVGLESLKVLG
jgi:hypothetical protein